MICRVYHLFFQARGTSIRYLFKFDAFRELGGTTGRYSRKKQAFEQVLSKIANRRSV